MSHSQNLASYSSLSQEQLLSLLKTKALILLVTDNFNLFSTNNCMVAPIRVRKSVAQIDKAERARKLLTYQSYAAQCIDIISRLDEEHLNKAADLNNSVVTELIDNRIMSALLESGIEHVELKSLLGRLKESSK